MLGATCSLDVSRGIENFVIDQRGVEHARQIVDLLDTLQDLVFVYGLEDYHQFAGGTFLM
ncbi:hypothetical protein D3C84_1295330 [compost metagenome]